MPLMTDEPVEFGDPSSFCQRIVYDISKPRYVFYERLFTRRTWSDDRKKGS